MQILVLSKFGRIIHRNGSEEKANQKITVESVPEWEEELSIICDGIVSSTLRVGSWTERKSGDITLFEFLLPVKHKNNLNTVPAGELLRLGVDLR
jgi:hypothetical protein